MYNFSSNDREPCAEIADVACTLAARDYKGPNNYGFNGVIEMEEVLGSLYVGKSDKFQKGMSVNTDISKTLMTGGECAIILGNTEDENMDAESPVRLGNVYDEKFGPSFGGGVWDTDGIAPTLKTTAAASQQHVVVHQQDNLMTEDGLCITQCAGLSGRYNVLLNDGESKYRIRKLTPKECFRLMGVRDVDFDKLTVSNSQKYKQAGNSIVVDVLMGIFENMFVKDCSDDIISLF